MSDSNFPTPPYPPAPGASAFGPVFPMSFGQILDRVFRLIRSHWKPFVGIGLLPIGAVVVFEGVLFGALFAEGVFQHPPAQPNAATILRIVVPLVVLGVPVLLLAYGVYYSASSYAALAADGGRTVTAREALRHAWSKAGRYVWLMVLRSLIIAIPIFVLVFAVAVGGMMLGLIQRGNPSPAALFFLLPLAILFYLGAVVYAVIMSLRLSLAFPACVQEGLTAMQAIKRSGVLTQGAKGRIFLMLLIIYAISYAFVMVMYAVGLFVFAIGSLAGAGNLHDMTPLGYFAVGLLGVCALVVVLLWSVLLMAAYSISFAVFYRDQRLRKDGPPPTPVPTAIAAES
ncbi:MAG TPA: hypothetical protein VN776_04320 [Terracidiphilus sp.]|nr:hypothetical protein [Terracidiphilus sp.]